LGARMINKVIEDNLGFLINQNVQVIWQTGKLYFDEYRKYDNSEGIQTHAFLNRMDLAYSAADFIISRAGAGSISELCIVGKPVIFIPSPNVAEDHQTKNALSVVEKEAALMLKETELEQFQDKVNVLLNQKDVQTKLSNQIKKLALPDATKKIADEVVHIVQLHHLNQ